MLRSVLSIIAGASVWAVLWVLSNVGLANAAPEQIREGFPVDSPGVLLTLLLLSVMFSVIAGFITAAVADRKEISHVLALGALQLSLGIYFQTQAWDLMPLWYHLTFLALLIPGNVAGGWFRLSRKLAPHPA